MSNKETELFVMITKPLLDSKAWRSMSLGARVLYVALKRRYWKDRKNNGRIFLSTRNAAVELGRDTKQIVRWFRELQHYGFIVQTRRGSLGTDGVGKAPHWRLTEVGYMGEHPTQEFLRWNGTPFRDIATTGTHKPKAGSRMAFCAGCGVEFKRTRNDAQYCSGPCRTRANRANGKRIPVGETTHTYVGETTHTATDKRGGNHPHIERITVGETTHISSIPSSRAGRPPWSTPSLTEIPLSEYSHATEMSLEEYEASKPRLRLVATH